MVILKPTRHSTQGPRDRPRLSPKYQRNGVPISSFLVPIPMISSFLVPIHGPGLIHSKLNQSYSHLNDPTPTPPDSTARPQPRPAPRPDPDTGPCLSMPNPMDLDLFNRACPPSPGRFARSGACSPGKTRLSRDDSHKRPRAARLRHWFSKIASVLNLKAREHRPVHHQGRGTGPSTEERRRAASLVPPRAYNAAASVMGPPHAGTSGHSKAQTPTLPRRQHYPDANTTQTPTLPRCQERKAATEGRNGKPQRKAATESRNGRP